MKRQALILFTAMLLAALPVAAQYTPAFQGDQVTLPLTEISAAFVGYNNLPWSMPGTEFDEYGWHGWLEATPGYMIVQFDVVYVVTHGACRFLVAAPREWRVGKTFYWEPSLGAYVIWYPDPANPTALDFELVSVHAGDGYADLIDGGLRYTGAPPIWWEVDPDHWLIQWRIEPFHYQMIDAPAPLEVE